MSLSTRSSRGQFTNQSDIQKVILTNYPGSYQKSIANLYFTFAFIVLYMYVCSKLWATLTFTRRQIQSDLYYHIIDYPRRFRFVVIIELCR